MKKVHMIALIVSCAIVAYMSETCDVVVVKGSDGGPLRINKDDYDADPGAYELFDAPAPVVTEPVAPAPVAPAPVAPAPVAIGVSKEGRKFVIVNSETGEKIVDERFNSSGYSNEQEAWAAVMAPAPVAAAT